MSDDPPSGKPNQMVDPFQDPPGRSGISPVILGGIAAAAIALAAGAWFVMRSPSDGGPTSTVAVVGENVNCRASPDMNGNVVRQLNGYAEFQSSESQADWVQVNAGDQPCWVNANYVVLNADQRAAEGESPRIAEYLRVAPGSVSTTSVDRTIPGETNDLRGDWVWDEAACEGSGEFLGFGSDGRFSAPDLLGDASWSSNENAVSIEWSAFQGDDISEPHTAGQATGILDWDGADRVVIFWNQTPVWGSTGDALIRCPS